MEQEDTKKVTGRKPTGIRQEGLGERVWSFRKNRNMTQTYNLQRGSALFQQSVSWNAN